MGRLHDWEERFRRRFLKHEDTRNSMLFRWRNSRMGLYRKAGALFYPIPKNASSSVHALLLHAEGLIERKELRDPAFNVDALLLRLGPPWNSQRRWIPRRDKRRLLKFSFVRNPWERLFSCWFEKIAHPDEQLLDRWWAKFYPGVNFREMGFADFARFAHDLPEWRMEAHFLPQCWFFAPSRMDFIGRVERFERDIERLVPLLAPAVREKIASVGAPRINPSGKPHYPDYYDQRARRLVERKYARDIKLFGYRFGD